MKTLLLLLLLSLSAWAQQDVLDRWLQDPRLQSAHVGFLLVRLFDGQVVAQHDPDKLFIPASTLKILTAKAILDVPHPPLHTQLWRQDDDLVLWGGGDPELTREQLLTLKDSGPRLFVGCPAQLNGPLGVGWAWDDTTEDYSAEICGLTYDRGVTPLTIHPENPVRVECAQPIMVQATVGTPARWGLSRLHDTVLWGTIPPGPPIQTDVTLTEPDLAAGRLLGFEPLRQTDPPHGTLLREVTSRPVEEMLREALSRSDNLAMELLCRACTGKPAPTVAGARVVDASGLSRYNLVSPRHLVAALQASPELRDLLPLAGRDGTMKRRLAGLPVRAKTGTVSTVSGLTGTFNGYAFALITNGFIAPGAELKGLEDALIRDLCAAARP